MVTKAFNDIVHGRMEFHPLIAKIIDTPQFQRLRHIKQLGSCCFVYPSAVHTRFEHSLGTAFLAGKLMDALNRKREASDYEEKVEKLCVQIAGLCHDLGHGPFSHLWERFLRQRNIKLTHEELSVKIFEEILKESTWDKMNSCYVTIKELFQRYNVDGHIEEIKEMILGRDKLRPGKMYLYQIIANKQNGIDVDKWDYLVRDSIMTGVRINFDCDRLLNICRICETQTGVKEICFRDKEYSLILNMFRSREFLHENVYQNRNVKIIDEMLVDAFTLASESLNLESTEVETFLNLTDRVFETILYGHFKEPKMLEAQQILRRVQRRELYTIIALHEIKATTKYNPRKIDQEKKRNILNKFYELLKSNESNELKKEFLSCTAISIKPPTISDDINPLKNIRKYTKKLELVNDNCTEFDDAMKCQDIVLILYKKTGVPKYSYDAVLKKVFEQSPQ